MQELSVVCSGSSQLIPVNNNNKANHDDDLIR